MLSSVAWCLEPVMKREARVFHILHKTMQEGGGLLKSCCGLNLSQNEETNQAIKSFHALFLQTLLYALDIIRNQNSGEPRTSLIAQQTNNLTKFCSNALNARM